MTECEHGKWENWVDLHDSPSEAELCAQVFRLRARVEKLREAGDRLIPFVDHGPECEITVGAVCTCGRDHALRAWREMRALDTDSGETT